MYVYLAVPIDSANGTSKDIAALLRAKLSERRIPFFTPHGAWSLTDGHHDQRDVAKAVSQINESAIEGAAVVLAVVEGPSVGVPAELAFAKMCAIPRVVLTTEGGNRLMLTALADSIHGDWPSALDAVERFMLTARKNAEVGLIEREVDVKEYPLPSQAYPGDIGLDLYVSDDFTVPSHEYRGVPTRVKVAPPEDVWFMILGRSSALHRRGLMVVPSVIDTGFRGTLFAMSYNITEAPVEVKRGERVAQLIPMRQIPFIFQEVAQVPASARDRKGFGSTGA